MYNIYDEDTGEKLKKPENYKGPFYSKVTDLHKDYLKALKDFGTNKFVDYKEWTEQCRKRKVKTNQGETPELLSSFMIYGVFVSRGLIEIKKGKKRNLYRLTEKGKHYLERI